MRTTSGSSAAERRGMSVVELLVVLVVIAILAGLATLGARRTRARGDLARVTGEAHNFRLAQEIYRANMGRTYNGPFTPEATKAAGFHYTPPPGITITIESSDENNWQATVASTSPDAGDGELRPTCRLSLSESVSCGLTPGRRQDLPDAATGGAPDAEAHPSR